MNVPRSRPYADGRTRTSFMRAALAACRSLVQGARRRAHLRLVSHCENRDMEEEEHVMHEIVGGLQLSPTSTCT